MKSNHLAEGFLIILISTVMVLLLDQMYGDESEPSQEQLAWTAPDTVSTATASVKPILEKNTELIGEESWGDIKASAAKIEQDLAILPQEKLGKFLSSLDQVKHKKKKRVRIAYFGDSMIEGDLVTSSLRNDLQQEFGGEGVGFVPITSETYGFRKTIRHRFSSDWKHYNFLTPNPTDHEFGISGELFLRQPPKNENKGKTWVKYKASQSYPTTKVFQQIKLYYGKQQTSTGNPANNYVIISTSQGKDTIKLDKTELVNEALLSHAPTDEIQLNFNIPNDLPVYGLSFEGQEGVYVDNFPSRGNSGMNLISIPSTTLETFNNHLHYDLVVLHFGLNVISTGRKSYKSYEEGMKKVINHFKTHMPNTDILMVSVSDKSTRIKGRLQTDPSVPLIVEAQQKVADEMNVGFLNLYEGMGGHNSMIKWVNANPSLANSDYTHPNRRGAKVVGDIVKKFILKEFESYATTPAVKNTVGSNWVSFK